MQTKSLNSHDKFFCINIVVLISYIFTTLYYYVENMYGHWSHTSNGELAKWPYNTFLFHPARKFGDFLPNYSSLNNKVVDFYFSLDLLPLWNSIHFTFSKIPSSNIALSLYLSAPLIVTLLLYRNKLKNIFDSNYQLNLNLIILIFLSYPILFSIDRANAEIYCFIFLSIFIFEFQNNPKLSLVFLVFALLVKPFPIVFLLLLLKKNNRYLIKYFIYYYLLASLLFYIYLFIFLADLDPTKFILKTTSYSSYTDVYIIGNSGLGYGHSLFGLLKIISYYLGFGDSINTLFKYYKYLAILIFSIFSIFIYRSNIYWKNITILVSLMCLLPYVSADYKLLHFFAPITLFITMASKYENFTKIISILFGLIISTKPFFSLKPLNPALISDAVGISTVIIPILIFMLVIILCLPNGNQKT